MLLSIIIVSYGTKDLTIQALKSACADINQSKLLKDGCEVIVVDNKSSDNSVSAVKEFFQQHKIKNQLILNQTNLGFAKANNIAIKRSTGQYILLLNSDTIMQPGCLEILVKSFIRNPLDGSSAYSSIENKVSDRLGIITPTLINPDGSIQPQGGSKPTLFSVFTQMFFLDDLPIIGKFLPASQHTGKNHRSLLKKYWISATAMMIRKEVLNEIGFLDEGIFMYGEDVEFCMRAQKHHWDVALIPTAKVTHLGSASSSSENAILGEFKGYVYIWSKHKKLWQTPLLKLILKFGAVLRVLIFGTILPDAKKRNIYQKAFKVV